MWEIFHLGRLQRTRRVARPTISGASGLFARGTGRKLFAGRLAPCEGFYGTIAKSPTKAGLLRSSSWRLPQVLLAPGKGDTTAQSQIYPTRIILPCGGAVTSQNERGVNVKLGLPQTTRSGAGDMRKNCLVSL
jgi:hypothetical protein